MLRQTENDISNFAELEQKVDMMNTKVRAIGKKLNDTERCIKTLDTHLAHSGNFKGYRKIKAKYEGLYSEYRTAKKETGLFSECKAQTALAAANEYCDNHRSEIAMFDNAEQYLRDVLQGRFDAKKLLPITKWTEERAGKIDEKNVLYQEYYSLKDETQKVEQIKRSIADILREDSREQSEERIPRKSRGMEL